MMYSERMRYLGALGLLSECSVYVPEEIRERIETAMEHACADGKLKWKRTLDLIQIESNPDYKEPAKVPRKSNMTDEEAMDYSRQKGDTNG